MMIDGNTTLIEIRLGPTYLQGEVKVNGSLQYVTDLDLRLGFLDQMGEGFNESYRRWRLSVPRRRFRARLRAFMRHLFAPDYIGRRFDIIPPHLLAAHADRAPEAPTNDTTDTTL